MLEKSFGMVYIDVKRAKFFLFTFYVFSGTFNGIKLAQKLIFIFLFIKFMVW